MAQRDSETGQYNETYQLEAFVDAVDQLGGDIGTKAVQDVVGCEYRTAIKKLHELEDAGFVTSRQVGNAYLWSLADTNAQERHDSGRESGTDESPPEVDNGSSDRSNIYDPTTDLE